MFTNRLFGMVVALGLVILVTLTIGDAIVTSKTGVRGSYQSDSVLLHPGVDTMNVAPLFSPETECAYVPESPYCEGRVTSSSTTDVAPVSRPSYGCNFDPDAPPCFE